MTRQNSHDAPSYPFSLFLVDTWTDVCVCVCVCVGVTQAKQTHHYIYVYKYKDGLRPKITVMFEFTQEEGNDDWSARGR